LLLLFWDGADRHLRRTHAFEEKMAKMTIHAHMTKEAPKESPVAADEPNLTQGATVYVANCAFCHGFPDQKASMAAKGMFLCRRSCSKRMTWSR